MKKTKAESLTPIFLQYKNGFIYSLAFFIIYGYITNSQYNQVPAGLIAQLEAGTASVSQSSWVRIPFRPEFFSGLNFTTSLKVVCITAMINHVIISFSPVQICDLSYIPLTWYMHPKPHIHVKNPSGNMSTRLRLYKVSLFTRSMAQRERSFIVGNLDVISLFARCWENSHSSLPVARWQK